MSFKEKIKSLLNYRISLGPNDDFETDEVWKKLYDAHKEFPIDEIISFIKNDATDEDIYWLSEIFDELFSGDSSIDLYQAYRERALKIENKTFLNSVLYELNLHE